MPHTFEANHPPPSHKPPPTLLQTTPHIPVVNQVLEILAHSNLPHKLVLVPIHTSQLPHMTERILQPVCQLIRIHVPQPKLHVAVHYELCETQDFTTQVECVTKSGFFAFLGGEGLDRLEVEVVVKMQVVEVFAVWVGGCARVCGWGCVGG